MSKEIYTSLTVYKGFLVVEHHVAESNDVVTSPYDRPGNMGYVISDLGHVALSQEAYDFLKALPKGRDSLGEIDLFRTSAGEGGEGYALAILGGACVLVSKDAETSRDYVVPSIDLFQLVANDPPAGAIHAIDGM